METTQKEFVRDVWPQVYSSRQNRSILRWPATGVEEQVLHKKDGEKEKILCLVVAEERVKGIIPLTESGIKISDTKAVNRGRLLKYIGQEVPFIVIGIDVENERFIASRRAALERLAAQAWPNISVGMTVDAVASRVYDNSVIVEFDGIEAYLPIYEISHGWVDEIFDIIQPGDKFKVKIIELDQENERVIVSIKELIPNPWPEAARRYEKNGFYRGTVTGITRYGIFVELEPGVNALCRHLKTNRFEIKRGDTVAMQIDKISMENGAGKINGKVIRLVRKK
ncbi:30S ribosomal protein S1 [Desulfallas sp. Bu1-1]|uniref:S1 RNA-binding domain-containing protein n=1 Tax=Desulfallas sp. Bu1-1 TaxID=2787620 RepID=UPI00189EE2AD|nr:S1 RNA-binding domain-containing protein [Desulfallas sp. Bu1-1]MBF7084391.1 30S ribosomal protein S1 [Desulfallas sp. Bu1-1]